MIRSRHRRALQSFIFVLVLFLLIIDIVIITQQRNALMKLVRDNLSRQLELMTDASSEALLKHDYTTISAFVRHWGEGHAEYASIRATAPNGFVIAEFSRPAPPGAPLFSLQRNVAQGGKGLMLLEITGDYSEGIAVVERLRNQLIAGSLLFSLLLGVALWYAMKRMALLPMELELEQRRRAGEELELKVAERTSELKQELVERRRIEQELLEREERIRLLLNSTAEAICGIDTRGYCTFCNPAGLRMLGLESEQDIVGKNLHEMVHHTRADGTCYPEEARGITRAYETGKAFHADDEVFWRADGTLFSVEYWSHPVFHEGRIIGAVITFMDITERRNLEGQLLQSRKMEAVGTLAGGVAHDFNNALTAIIGYASILKLKLGNVPLAVNADHLLEAAQRAAQLTNSLLAFSRKQEIITRPVDVNGLVSRMGRLIARVIREDVMFETVLAPGELMVMADSSTLEQVLMNLATNARDAMPDGGLLGIRTERVVLRAGDPRVQGEVGPGEYALISVSDTGMGMDEKTRQKIFEPFFTTKEVGKGTGLGLAMVYGNIKKHKGFVNVSSEKGKGTMFMIYLPIVASGATEPERVAVEEPAPRGTETILVAEDDPSLRGLAKSLLEEHGYRVIEAEDGEDALRKFRKHPEEVRLLLLDIIMPRMNGGKVYEEIRKLRPDIKALFMSGYTADLINIRDILARDKHDLDFMQKPMRPSELLVKVRTTLDH